MKFNLLKLIVAGSAESAAEPATWEPASEGKCYTYNTMNIYVACMPTNV